MNDREYDRNLDKEWIMYIYIYILKNLGQREPTSKRTYIDLDRFVIEFLSIQWSLVIILIKKCFTSLTYSFSTAKALHFNEILGAFFIKQTVFRRKIYRSMKSLWLKHIMFKKRK